MMTRRLQSLLLVLAVAIQEGAVMVNAKSKKDSSSPEAEQLQQALDTANQKWQEMESAKQAMEQSFQQEIAALKESHAAVEQSLRESHASVEQSLQACQADLETWPGRMETAVQQTKEEADKLMQDVVARSEEAHRQHGVQMAQQAEHSQKRIQALTTDKTDLEQHVHALKQQLNTAKDRTLKVRQELVKATEQLKDLEAKAQETILTKTWRSLKETDETRPVVDLLEETAVWVQDEVLAPTQKRLSLAKENSQRSLEDGWKAMEPTRNQVSEAMKPVTDSPQFQSVLAYRRSLLDEAESWIRTSSTTVENYCKLQEKSSSNSIVNTKLYQGSQYAKQNSQSIVKWTERFLYLLQFYALVVILMYTFSSSSKTKKTAAAASDSESIANGLLKEEEKKQNNQKQASTPGKKNKQKNKGGASNGKAKHH